MTPDQWAQLVLWVPFAIAVVVAASVAINNPDRLTKPMGLAKWDFNQSWASNITIASGVVSFGLLTTLLNNQETWLLSNHDYAYFVLFFPALVTLAPIIYNFTRQVKIISGPPVEVTIQGRTFTFLLAAALTVWGAAGQLEIQAGLVMSLFQLNKIDLHPTVVVVVLLVVVFCALPIYSWLTMNAAVRIQPALGSHPSIRAATDFGYYSGWALL